MPLLVGCCLLLAAACVEVPARTAAEVAADVALTERLQASLSADPMFYFAHVDVEAQRAVVTLNGYVQTREAKFQARRLAKRAGAVRVVDLIKLDREDKHP
ncbi:MAG TPA: BON domain-containing protein [Steroidobacteraceae bacterium]|jgi:osmotically-inducible protein OsmY|nr:BON domain-containing protein [Steroidobacteraceae bacterium]